MGEKMGSAVANIDRKPSVTLSLVIFVVLVTTMGFLRFHLFHDRFIALTYGLPLLVCLWHKDRRLLWSMAGTFTVMAAVKAFFLLPDPNAHDWTEFVQWLMQVANIIVIASAVHAILDLTGRLHARNVELAEANEEISRQNDELRAREEEISRQNDELQTQSEELAQQNEELQQQTEELNRQNEEMQQQSEELEQQTEELQTQAEELRTTNDELNQRESILATILASLQGDRSDEREMMARICQSLVPLLGGAAVAAAVVEQDGEELVARTHTNLDDLAQERWPLKESFARIVMERSQTAFIDDLAARPDLVISQSKRQRFRSILAAPLLLHGKTIGAVEAYAEQPQRWTAEQFRIIEWVAAQCSMILEITRAEAALRESEARLRAMADAIPQLAWIAHGDGFIHWYNRQWYAYTGTTPQEMEGWGWQSVHDPEILPEVMEQWKAAIATGEPFEMIFPLRGADGRFRPFLTRAQPLKDSQGRVAHWFGTNTDVEAMKQAEEALRKSEERYRTLFNSLIMGFCTIEVLFDGDGKPVDYRFLEINPAFEGQTGLRNAQGKRIRELVPDNEEYWFEIYGKVALTGEPARFVNEAKALGRWYDVSAYRVEGPKSRKVAIIFNDITEGKRAEESLRESESFHRQTLESIPGMVFTTRPDGYCDYQSQQWVEYTGVPMREHHGDGWGNLLHPDDRPRALAAWQDAVEGRAPYDLEYRVRRHDGEYEWFKVIGRPIRDAAGQIVRWFGVAANIDGLKRAEAAAGRHSSLMEGINRILNAALTCQTEEQLGEACLQVAETITQSRFGFIGQITEAGLQEIAISNPGWDACNIIRPDGHRKPLDNFAIHGIYGRVLQDGKSLIANDPPSHPDSIGLPAGHPPLEAFLGVPLAREGRTMGMIAVANREGGYTQEDVDVLESLAPAIVEAFLRKRTEGLLRESEDRFRTMADGLPLIIWVHDAQGDLRFVNSAYREFFDVTPEQVRGGGWQPLVHPDDAASYAEEFLACVRDRRAFRAEARVRRADGQWRWIESYGKPRFSNAGEFLGFVGTSPDITDRKQAERQLKEWSETLERRVAERTAEAEHRAKQLQRLAGELTQAEQKERQRLATILHDHLQQLLVGAKFHLNILHSQTTDAPVREGLRHVDDLLDQSLTTSRSLTVELSPPILYEGTFAQVLQWLARWAREKHALAVDVRADEQVNVQDRSVRALLFQAIRELLLNVRKHAKVNKACIWMKRNGRQMEIVVADEGAGFDPAARHRDSHGNGSGSGFGLFSIGERLELLAGRMEVASCPGQGTRVRLVAPLEASAPEAAAPSPASPVAGQAGDKQPSPVHDGQKIRVLLADDHAVVRDGLARLLGTQPDIAVVGQAEDGLEAVELALRLRPDVVVMDVSMPNLGGVEATRRILRDMPEARVIGLSMHVQEDVAAQMSAAGAAAYLTKTSQPPKLLAAIRECGRGMPQG
jgi:PAS domain S-box-containing protein